MHDPEMKLCYYFALMLGFLGQPRLLWCSQQTRRNKDGSCALKKKHSEGITNYAALLHKQQIYLRKQPC